jgi:hypothetical protein
MDYIYAQFYVNIVTPPNILIFKINFFRLNFLCTFSFFFWLALMFHCRVIPIPPKRRRTLNITRAVISTPRRIATGVHNSVPSLEQMRERKEKGKRLSIIYSNERLLGRMDRMSRGEPRCRKIGDCERCNQHRSGYCHRWEIRRERGRCAGSPVFLRGQFRSVLNVGGGIHRG